MIEQPDMYDVDVVARTVYGEARGESQEGRIAVAKVIVNRWRHSGGSLESVCKKPKQFSCWNVDDPNYPIIKDVTYADQVFLQCLSAVAVALDLKAADPTKGSRHYHAPRVSPYWAVGHTPVVEIGGHVFYNDVG